MNRKSEDNWPGARDDYHDPLTNAELQVVLDSVRDLNSTLSTAEVIDRLLGRTLTHLDAEIGSVQALEGEVLRIMAARGLPQEVVEESELRIDEGISGFVARTGQPLLVEDVDEDPRFTGRCLERYYTRSFLSAPLVSSGVVYGVLNVNNKRDRRIFNLTDLRLLEAIAGHAALALRNASLYEDAVERSRLDPLTGLSNHRHFWDELEIELERADRYQRTLSVVMIDIDHFKSYNDTYGHLGGDAAIQGVARLIFAGCRSSDLAARYGGEEFALILPETSPQGALDFAQKIRASLENQRFCEDDRAELTASLGVASYPADGRTSTELVRVADQRLYKAKDAGRNQVVHCD
ncbi:MAG: sensor domain-containing diguanylate cyclase [bacterium]|nr:sensor domain-containing diguanylate cyclase [bacterium]